MIPSVQRHSCVSCAGRKVRCDRRKPCSNCSRRRSECVYESPAHSQRHRPRPSSDALLSKISEYESILRKNSIKFQPLDNQWISSPLEEKLGAPTPGTEKVLGSQPQEEHPPADLTHMQSHTVHPWFDLPEELRNFSIEQFKRPKQVAEDDATEAPSGQNVVTHLLIPVRIDISPQFLELHPTPKHIFKLWQAFAENVNPLTKVVHTPSLEKRILETSWNMEQVTKPLEAVMFAIYALAVTSMKGAECKDIFGGAKSVLLNRYRSGAAQALVAAELHSTRDLETLQALVLFLLLEPRSEFSATAVATATRIGHRMGLHLTGTDPHMPFFEEEMRLRVWWQIMNMDSHARRKVLGLAPSMAEYGNVRLPMNLNDIDLHPNMGRPTAQHTGATEMLYCLLKYEIAYYARSWLRSPATANTNPYNLTNSNGRVVTEMKNKVLADLEQIYEDKYLRHCDPSIPLHHISATVARLTLYRLRFWYHHPRNQPDRGAHMSRSDQDAVFESSIRLVQLSYDMRRTGFSAHLLEYQLKRTEVDALVYMVSELRRRPPAAGDAVRAAWALVRSTYEDCPQLLGRDEAFSAALGDLTLEAWAARSEASGDGADEVPAFIQKLQERGADRENAPAVDMDATFSNGDYQFGLMEDDLLNWLYWDDASQFDT